MIRLAILFLFAAQAVLPPALCLCRLEAMVLAGHEDGDCAGHEHEEIADHGDDRHGHSGEEHEESCGCLRPDSEAIRPGEVVVSSDSTVASAPAQFETIPVPGSADFHPISHRFPVAERPLYLTLRAFLI